MTTNIIVEHTGHIDITEPNDNPLCLDDIISICKEFNQLGIQSQIDNLLDMGVEEAINSGTVKQKYLPSIKYFLGKIMANPLFGEARDQAQDCLGLIGIYEEAHKQISCILN
jgi:hypothetical protein